TWYYYRDASGGYSLFEPAETELITVEIPRSSARTAGYHAAYDGEIYAAKAEALVSPVNVRATIVVTAPGAWSAPWGSIDELREANRDMIGEYVLIVDGETYSGIDEVSWSGDMLTLSGEFAVAVKDAGSLRLRPVYAIRGEAPDEDLILRRAS
ncbi:MAG: hypothetical protein GX558_02775, partial [Clostridiales bacterium]|nr:hypothetical protein [Clostridiales bacterium]